MRIVTLSQVRASGLRLSIPPGFLPADLLAKVAPLDVAGLDLEALKAYGDGLDAWEDDGGAPRESHRLFTRLATMGGLPVLAAPWMSENAVFVVDISGGKPALSPPTK